MAPRTKTINQIVSTVEAVNAQILIDISDDHDTGDNHPGCAFATVRLRDGEFQTVWLQHVTRDASGNITGRVPAPGGPLTGTELTTIRSLLGKVFNSAATAAGYT